MHTTPNLRHRQRGTTLIEAMLAFLVLALGMLAISRAQSHMRLHADVSRQTSEAVRLAHEELESLRSFTGLAAAAGVASYAGIGSRSHDVDAASGYLTNTRYRVQRQVDELAAAPAKAVTLSVSWDDRSGSAQQVALHSFIAGIDPAHTGALGLTRGTAGAPAGRPLGRSLRIPPAAKDLGDGSSAFKPVSDGPLVLVFDNLTGQLVKRCTGVDPALATRDLSAGALGSCTAAIAAGTAGAALLLSGSVRFTSASPPDAARANDAPLPASIALALSGSGYPAAPECSTEAMKTVAYTLAGSLRREAVPIAALPATLGLAAWADTGERHLAYHCIVTTRPDGRWSGRTTLVASGWAIGTAAAAKRVCRYSSDLDGSGAVDANLEHPARYADVDAALARQNFLVINGTEACPVGAAATIAGVASGLATAQHQP